MNVLLIVIASISAITWLGLGLLFYMTMHNKPIFRGTAFSGKEITYPSLSIVIAACNEEESIEQTVTRLLNQDYPGLELIVVNDRSTDSTGVILAELDIKYSQLKVITITALPPNWLGKNHAVHQGAKHATGAWILLTDADVMFSPDSLKKTISYALEHKLDHLTILPDVVNRGFFFRGFFSLFMFSMTVTFATKRCAGFATFNLLKRSVYEAIGGYEAIAMQVIDDFSLGQLVVKQGYRQNFGYSKGLTSVKFYDSLSATFKGFEKNFFGCTNYSVTGLLLTCCLILFLHVYPFVGLLFGPQLARVLCGVPVITVFIIYHYGNRYIDAPTVNFFIHPISALLYIGVLLNSMIKTLRQGGINWRGTFYSLKELRKYTSF
ncbi:MAG: glycosyltransferase family 2 protein [Desulfosporosinus sp.]|nr:glycosyltransferase family 2 protein [Desulfosporosinus sp.]